MNKQQCPQCSKLVIPRFKILKMADDSPHSYKKVCEGCDRYIAWVSHGEVNYNTMISSIDLVELSEKEFDFVTKSVKNCMIRGNDLSDKQSKWLDAILRKYQDLS